MPYKDPEVRRKKQRDYMREYSRERYANDPEYRRNILAKSKKHRDLYLSKFDPLIAEFKKDGCLLCDEKEHCCLVAHHVDPSEKDYEIGFMRKSLMSLDKIVAELKKCVCLCSNCHNKLHAGLLSLEGRN